MGNISVKKPKYSESSYKFNQVNIIVFILEIRSVEMFKIYEEHFLSKTISFWIDYNWKGELHTNFEDQFCFYSCLNTSLLQECFICDLLTRQPI